MVDMQKSPVHKHWHGKGLLFLLALLIGSGTGIATAIQDADANRERPAISAAMRSPLQLVETQCARCHTEGDAEGDVVFWANHQWQLPSARLLRDAAEAVSENWMPLEREDEPAPHPPMTAEERETLANWLIAQADLSAAPPLSHARRMNREEIEQAISLIFNRPVSAEGFLPHETPIDGFDTIPGSGSLQLDASWLNAYLDWLDEEMRHLNGELTLTHINIIGSDFEVTDGQGGNNNGNGCLLWTNGTLATDLTVQREGTYTLSLQLWQMPCGDEAAQVAIQIGDRWLTHQTDITGTAESPQIYEAEVPLSPGRHRLQVHFINDAWEPESPEGRRDRNLGLLHATLSEQEPQSAGTPDWWHLPEDPNHRHAWRSAETSLQQLIHRTWRGFPAIDGLEQAMALYYDCREAGDSYEQALCCAAQFVLTSPRFLMLPAVEQQDSRFSRDLATASRLAQLFGNALPDEQLILAARRNALDTPNDRLRHARRLLNENGADAFGNRFVDQWLLLDLINTWQPDVDTLPEATPELRTSMRKEIHYRIWHQLQTDAPFLHLLDAPTLHLDASLADHYGLPAPEQTDEAGFGEVDVRRHWRGGLLSTAAFSAMTSSPTRAHPVLRGKWVLEVLLDQAPPPPPPDIPSLDSLGDISQLSMREQLALHRSDPLCAACHVRMDPIGLALEELDALARRRPDATSLDLSGELPDGRYFNGLQELQRALEDDEDRLREVFLNRLMTFALGRIPAHPDDRTAANRILQAAEAEGGSLQDVLMAFVADPVFTGSNP